VSRARGERINGAVAKAPGKTPNAFKKKDGLSLKDPTFDAGNKAYIWFVWLRERRE
jgi:hypothetical protein